jgi:hypothetical protein
MCARFRRDFLAGRSLYRSYRGPHSCRRHYPAIACAATRRAKSFTLDDEAVVCGPDDVAMFGSLHRRGTGREVMLYAFELLELDDEDPSQLAAPRSQEAPREAAGRAPARHRAERPHRRGRRHTPEMIDSSTP